MNLRKSDCCVHYRQRLRSVIIDGVKPGFDNTMSKSTIERSK